MDIRRTLGLITSIGIPLAFLAIPTSMIPIPELTLVQHRIIAVFVMAALMWVLKPVPVFMDTRRTWSLIASIGIPLAFLAIPTSMIPLPELTLVQHRIIAIFVMAALMWVLEPVPVFATSLLIITLQVVMISNKGMSLFISGGSADAQLGSLLPYNSIFAAFASPIIILFMGGFSLAIAASKYEFDGNLARVLLKPFGNRIHKVMLGLMLITAVFSMFMSNTATTVMMKVVMLRPTDFPMVSIIVLMFTLIPASKRMMLSAMMLIKGDRDMKSSASKKFSTGPSVMPNASSHMMSGIFVLL